MALITGCHNQADRQFEKYSETRSMMGTYAQIDTCRKQLNDEKRSKLYGRLWERLEEIAWRMNVFDKRSDVTRINASFAGGVTVPEDTYFVIKESLRLNRLSDGVFDITVGPLISLWQAAGDNGKLPDPSEVKRIKQAVGPENIRLLEAGAIQLTHPQTRIDLGGVAAGYALDEAARIFKEEGVDDFYIDIGGDIFVGGTNCRKEKWRIGIRDPRDKTSLIDVIALSDAAVTTSGNYEKYVMIDGQKFSHIINPLTGYPQQAVISATVVCPTGIEADALATAATVLGHQRAMELFDELGDGYAAMTMEDLGDQPVRFASENYKEFLIKK